MQRLTEQEKVRIAELSALGLPSRLIGKQIGRHHRTVWGYISRSRRKPLAPRSRSPLRLSLLEREEISRGAARGESLRAIARRIGRAPSTVSREIARNGGRRRYRACRADGAALDHARRPKAAKLARCPQLRAVVEAKLTLRWSPQQIAGWLPRAFPDDAEMRVSHETIYLSLFVQSRGVAQGTHPPAAQRPRLASPARTLDLQRPGSPARDPQHQRATRRGRRSGRARPLGRRPAVRQTDDRHGHPRRTTQPIRVARRSTRRAPR